MYSSAGMRITLSITYLRKWRLYKLELRNAFLQTNKAKRDVYVTSRANRATALAVSGYFFRRPTA